MAHHPSDAMRRLLAVAVGGVATLAGIALCGAGLLIWAGAREPGASDGWRIAGVALAAAGGLLFLGAGVVTGWLVVDWRRNRDERSNRP
ncbi:MAG: hypothetical protein JNJ88_06705 [Planctomycetes bacterium]|nr:hypothetical protein [Planctomycetota bacterium]